MKQCTKLSHLLYLYPELTGVQKNLIDSHLLGCDTCRNLFVLLQANHNLVERAAHVTIIPQNAAKLTANIMEAVHAQTHKKQSHFTQWIESVWTRYTLAGASFALIVLFMIEQQPAPQANMLSSTTTIEPKTVTLNTTTLLEEVRKNHETKNTSSKPSFYACAKNNACENELIKNYKLKKSS
jgi:predicted anti-sigma-YlaC factor YlaD